MRLFVLLLVVFISGCNDALSTNGTEIKETCLEEDAPDAWAICDRCDCDVLFQEQAKVEAEMVKIVEEYKEKGAVSTETGNRLALLKMRHDEILVQRIDKWCSAERANPEKESYLAIKS